MGHSGERWLAGGKEAIEGLEERHDLAPFARSLPAQDLGQGPRAAAGASQGALGVTPVRDDSAVDPGGSPWGRRWAVGLWCEGGGDGTCRQADLLGVSGE